MQIHQQSSGVSQKKEADRIEFGDLEDELPK